MLKFQQSTKIFSMSALSEDVNFRFKGRPDSGKATFFLFHA